MSFPSIQSFYQKETPSSSPSKPLKPVKPTLHSQSDGFTPSEVETALRPTTQTWKPQEHYERVAIADLQPGPCRVRFTARIVNFTPSKETDNRRSMLPQGFHLLVVKDETGVVAIKLLATNDHEVLQLGKLVTVWASFVAEYTTASQVRLPLVSYIIAVHPSQTSSSCIKFHKETEGSEEASRCRIPLDLLSSSQSSSSSSLPGLMSLKAYLNSGHEDVPGAKILVCVSSVGPRKIVKSGNAMAEVRVFDETESNCVLKVWEDKVPSAKGWIPNQTILLITNPRCRLPDKKNATSELSIGITSMIEVDPICSDATWLRNMASNRTKRSVCVPFPDGLWDVETAINGDQRIIFTLADVDDFARDDDNSLFTGKLNLVIMSVHIAENWRRGMMCCTECCGVPLYSNTPFALCKNCGTGHTLTLNPRLIGQLADETGSLATGKLVWSNRAWTELLFGTNQSIPTDESTSGMMVVGSDSAAQGETTLVITDKAPHQYSGDHEKNPSWKELTTLNALEIRDVEEHLLFSRITLTFGWSSNLGRLCVLGVEW